MSPILASENLTIIVWQGWHFCPLEKQPVQEQVCKSCEYYDKGSTAWCKRK